MTFFYLMKKLEIKKHAHSTHKAYIYFHPYGPPIVEKDATHCAPSHLQELRLVGNEDL